MQQLAGHQRKPAGSVKNEFNALLLLETAA